MDPFESPIIVKKNLSEQVADKIRNKILRLEFAPDTRFIIDELAKEIGVSRTPIREGLNKLVEQGLIAYDGKAYKIRRLTPEDVYEVYEIRHAIEKLAVMKAAEKILPEDLERLREFCNKDLLKKDKSPEFMFYYDLEFHKVIAKATGNSRLQGIITNLLEQGWFLHYWGFSPEEIDAIENLTFDEHFRILEKIEHRDPEGAAKMMERHLQTAEKNTLKCLGLV